MNIKTRLVCFIWYYTRSNYTKRWRKVNLHGQINLPLKCFHAKSTPAFAPCYKEQHTTICRLCARFAWAPRLKQNDFKIVTLLALLLRRFEIPTCCLLNVCRSHFFFLVLALSVSSLYYQTPYQPSAVTRDSIVVSTNWILPSIILR